MRFYGFDIHNLSQDPRFGGFTRWTGQPGWVWRLAILTTLIFVVLPLVAVFLVLGLAFALTFGVAFALFAGANRLGRFFGGLGRSLQRAAPDGRRNVRVIRHDEGPL